MVDFVIALLIAVGVLLVLVLVALRRIFPLSSRGLLGPGTPLHDDDDDDHATW